MLTTLSQGRHRSQNSILRDLSFRNRNYKHICSTTEKEGDCILNVPGARSLSIWRLHLLKSRLLFTRAGEQYKPSVGFKDCLKKLTLFCHAFTQPISSVCHVLATPLSPPQRDIIHGWPLLAENHCHICLILVWYNNIGNVVQRPFRQGTMYIRRLQ